MINLILRNVYHCHTLLHEDIVRNNEISSLISHHQIITVNLLPLRCIAVHCTKVSGGAQTVV